MSKQIKIILIILATLIVSFVGILIIFLKSANLVLEYEDVSHFDTKEISATNYREYLLISGSSNHSALNTLEIKETLEQRDMVVRVYMSLVRTNNSDDSFLHAVKIDDNIDRVLFGEERKIIWERIQ